MTDQCLTDELALRAFGWRKAPGRYIKANRGWTPQARFRPLVDIGHAVSLIDAVSNDYSITAEPGGTSIVRVIASGRAKQRSGPDKARTICLAVADLLGIHWEAND